MKLTEAQIEERERLRQAEMKVNIHVYKITNDKALYCFIHYQRELEKVKRRRIEREREKEARDNEMVIDIIL